MQTVGMQFFWNGYDLTKHVTLQFNTYSKPLFQNKLFAKVSKRHKAVPQNQVPITSFVFLHESAFWMNRLN